MRNMSFMLTTDQVYSKTKTVTRRRGWWFLKPGDIVCAVEKGMGLKKGKKIKKICPISIVSVRREPLHCISSEEVFKEGFPGASPEWFIAMFCKSHKGTHLNSIVNRIEFEYL